MKTRPAGTAEECAALLAGMFTASDLGGKRCWWLTRGSRLLEETTATSRVSGAVQAPARVNCAPVRLFSAPPRTVN